MTKITREQAERWTAQASNGFVFDIRHYVIWGDKELVKRIPLDNGEDILEIKLLYMPEYETKTNQYGCKWKTETGRQIPNIHYQVYQPTGTGLYSSWGIGTFEPIGEPETKKNYKRLCELSATVDITPIIDEANNAA